MRLAMAHDHDLLTFASVVVYKHAPVIQQGLLVLDDAAFRESEEAFQVARELGDTTRWGSPDTAWALRCWRRVPTSNAGMQMLTEIREMCDRRQFFKTELPILDLLAAREDALNGNVDAALPVMRAAVDTLFEQRPAHTLYWATSVLVVALLDRGTDGDVTGSRRCNRAARRSTY